MPYLVLKVDGQEVCRQELKPDEPITIGRALECTLWLANPKLSRQHCRVFADQGRWLVADLNSRNGTFVDGQRIDQHVLDDGDTFELDNARLTFRDGPFVPKRAAAPDTGPVTLPPPDLLAEDAKTPPNSSAESSLFATRAVAQARPVRRPSHMDSTLIGQKPLAFTRPPAEPKVAPAPAPLAPPKSAQRRNIIIMVLIAALALMALLWRLLA